MKTDPVPTPPRPAGKVFDVRRPGKAPASPTSRPVIMGHKVEAQRTQVAVSGIGEREPVLDAKQKVTITLPKTEPESKPKPPESAQQPTNAETELVADQAALADLAISGVEAEPLPHPSAPFVPEPQAVTPPPASAVPAPSTPVKPLTPEEIAAASAAAADMAPPKAAAGPVVAASKPVTHTLRTVVLVLILVMIAVLVFDILLDAGVLTVNLPHTHFFGI